MNKKEKKATAMDVVKQLSSPAKDSCAEPYLFTDSKGVIYLSWIEKRGKENCLKFSTFQNDTWTDPVVISTGNNWFVNWADYPILAADGANNLMAHFLAKNGDSKYAYDVKVLNSENSGKSWSTAKTLHDDGKQAEHGFVSMVPFNNDFLVSWLDGRNTGTEEGKAGHEGHHGQMSLRGALIDKQGNKKDEWELDNRVCDCCQTSATITTNGPVVVYRDRSEDEIRDMSIVRYVNRAWTAPKTVFFDNWKITGCPVNGPRSDAIGNQLAIAWFSMADKNAQVNLIFSEDGGVTFNKPIRVDEGKPIGRVDVIMLDEKTAMVSWMEGTAIKAVKIKSDGSKETSIMIATSSESRSSGFPQMTKSGRRLIFAWTDDKQKTIRIASLSLNTL
ncbi:MAG: sialidase family protein [Chitinophagaceae bacterium]